MPRKGESKVINIEMSLPSLRALNPLRLISRTKKLIRYRLLKRLQPENEVLEFDDPPEYEAAESHHYADHSHHENAVAFAKAAVPIVQHETQYQVLPRHIKLLQHHVEDQAQTFDGKGIISTPEIMELPEKHAYAKIIRPAQPQLLAEREVTEVNGGGKFHASQLFPIEKLSQKVIHLPISLLREYDEYGLKSHTPLLKHMDHSGAVYMPLDETQLSLDENNNKQNRWQQENSDYSYYRPTAYEPRYRKFMKHLADELYEESMPRKMRDERFELKPKSSEKGKIFDDFDVDDSMKSFRKNYKKKQWRDDLFHQIVINSNDNFDPYFSWGASSKRGYVDRKRKRNLPKFTHKSVRQHVRKYKSPLSKFKINSSKFENFHSKPRSNHNPYKLRNDDVVLDQPKYQELPGMHFISSGYDMRL